MATFADFLPGVRLEVSEAPKQVLINAVTLALREVCDRSLIWQYTTDDLLIPAGSNELDVDDLPSDAEVSRVVSCTLDGVPIALGGRGSLAADGSVITLDSDVSQDTTANLVLALRPTMSASSIPDWMVSDLFETVVHGALYRLQANASKEWSNPTSAQFHFSAFRSGMGRARIDALRGGRHVNACRVKPVPFV